MSTTQTSNKGYTEVDVGTENGSWGPFLNANMGVLDNNLGGVATVALTNSPVVLSSGQYACAFIRFTGALTADVTVTFPAVGSFYSIINDTTNSSAFCVIAAITAGTQSIGLPVGVTDMLTESTRARFRSLPPVGSYLTIAKSSTPRWIGSCTIPPYLNCDGSAFSAVTYPALAASLGGTTLPDARGRVNAALNQGTARLNHGTVDGDTLLAGSDDDAFAIAQNELPNYDLTVTDPGHVHTQNALTRYNAGGAVGTAGGSNNNTDATKTTLSAVTGITVNSGGNGDEFGVVQPTLVAGVILIRAA